MIDLARIKQARLATEPYAWAMIDGLYASRDAWRLANSYPRDHFKTMIGRDEEKEWRYEVRSLIGMGLVRRATPINSIHCGKHSSKICCQMITAQL